MTARKNKLSGVRSEWQGGTRNQVYYKLLFCCDQKCLQLNYIAIKYIHVNIDKKIQIFNMQTLTACQFKQLKYNLQ